MNGTAAMLIGQVSAAPAFQDGLYTSDRHLYYLAMETFIYEYRKSIGMLNVYADPFYLLTVKGNYTMENKGKDIKHKEVIKDKNFSGKKAIQTKRIRNNKTISEPI